MMLKELITKNSSKIIMLIMDGVGGIKTADFPETALEAARTPHLDFLARAAACGRSMPISRGVTPGSGPAHLALFGYDPLDPANNAGRGVVEVTGAGYDLKDSDIAIRGNFATMDAQGVLTDRRAGRIPHDECIRLCGMLSSAIKIIDGVEIRTVPVKEYRFGVILSGEGLSPDVAETDPQVTGKKPLPARAMDPAAERTASVIAEYVRQAQETLKDEEKANTVLMRGISRKPTLEHFEHRYGLKAAGIAAYPLYRGVARLCGMDLVETGPSPEEEFEKARSIYETHDFLFIHVKKTDSYGEDGNLDGKVSIIEAVDRSLPVLTSLDPDVLIVTGDHSTPCAMKSHSWHPVPFMVKSARCGIDASTRFTESECDRGSLGVFPALSIMELAMANAGMLKKFGA